MKALLLVDIQNDFMPGGALAVNRGNEIIPVINNILTYPFDYFVAAKDWHPPNHGSFACHHEGKKEGDHINLAGLDQILWPQHCVQGSFGAEFAPSWDTAVIDKVIYKGTDPLIDSYSIFYDNGHRQSTHLESYLREHEVTQVFVAGLATDYCVKYSVFDALELGFRCFVIVDACRGVNLNRDDSDKALQEMKERGAILIDSKQIMDKNFI